jgi:hypothetical protein
MRELPPPISVEEALRDATFNINVQEGMDVTLGPFEAQYSEAFRLAEVTTFEGLHLLGFIQKEIAEEQILKAIRADDRVFRESHQRQHMIGHKPSCSCEERETRTVAEIPRRQFQDHLIDLLQPLYRDLLRADDPAVIHPYRHARAWMGRPNLCLIGLFALNDINIGDNATLTMTPTVQALYANDINIGKNGRLRFTSGGIHVRCSTLNGPSRFSSVVNFEKYVSGFSREVQR